MIFWRYCFSVGKKKINLAFLSSSLSKQFKFNVESYFTFWASFFLFYKMLQFFSFNKTSSFYSTVGGRTLTPRCTCKGQYLPYERQQHVCSALNVFHLPVPHVSTSSRNRWKGDFSWTALLSRCTQHALSSVETKPRAWRTSRMT